MSSFRRKSPTNAAPESSIFVNGGAQKPKYPVEIFKKWSVAFYVIYLLLFVSLIASVFVLGFCGDRLSTARMQAKYIETAVSITSAAVAVSREFFLLSSGEVLSDIRHHVDDSLNKIKKGAGKLGLSITDVRSSVEQGRAIMGSETAEKVVTAFEDYNNAAWRLSEALRPAFAKLAKDGFIPHASLFCVLSNAIHLYQRYTLLIPSVLPGWGLPEYIRYTGSLYEPSIIGECSAYLSGLDESFLVDLAGRSQKLQVRPALSLPAEIDAATTNLLMTYETLAGEVETQGALIISYLKGRRQHMTNIVWLASVSAAVVLFFLVTMPICILPSMAQSRQDIQRQYDKIEGKTKIVVQLLPLIATLKMDSNLHFYVRDCFLAKIEGFMTRVRPYIMQTCFGDVEGVLFSNDGGISQIRGDEGDGHSAEDEQRSMQLRTELGLQVAFGTFLCVATASHVPMSDTLSDEQYQTFLHARMERIISEVECAAEKTRGVVHNIAGDYIFVTWGITSSCRSAEMNALQAALRLMRIGPELNGLSIGISQSPIITGNIESGGRISSIFCGPAVSKCEILESLNAYHGTSLMFDEGVATKVNALANNYCVVPIALYRWKEKRTSGYEVAYTIYNTPLLKLNRSWINIFKEFPMMLSENRTSEMLEMVNEYKRAYISVNETGGSGQPPEIAKTIDYWLLFLTRYQNRGSSSFHER